MFNFFIRNIFFLLQSCSHILPPNVFSFIHETTVYSVRILYILYILYTVYSSAMFFIYFFDQGRGGGLALCMYYTILEYTQYHHRTRKRENIRVCPALQTFKFITVFKNPIREKNLC